MSSFEDELARLRADMDQGIEAMKEMARAMYAYYKDLLDEGFDPQQALTIVVAYQAVMISSHGGGE